MSTVDISNRVTLFSSLSAHALPADCHPLSRTRTKSFRRRCFRRAFTSVDLSDLR
jgi:hypothetical protein